MAEFWITLLLGVVFCVIGVINMTGNISMLHGYHRKRVAEEDKKPMGVRVGMGMLCIGGSMILSSVLGILSTTLAITALFWASMVVLVVGLVVGCIIAIAAIIKYNKGLF